MLLPLPIARYTQSGTVGGVAWSNSSLATSCQDPGETTIVAAIQVVSDYALKVTSANCRHPNV